MGGNEAGQAIHITGGVSMNSQDRERMGVALEEARKALAEGEIPVGAALYRGDTLLWADHNRREQLHDPTAHAEMICLRHGAMEKGDWRLKDCTLYVTLEPCPMCAGAIMSARISRLVYGATDARAGAVESIFNIPGHPSLAPSPIITAGVMEDECKTLLQSFFAARR